MGSIDPRGKTGEWLRVTGPWRPAPCDRLDDAAAADFVDDGVEARGPLWRTRINVGDPAYLLDVDGIGRVGDGGMALKVKTDSGAVVNKGKPRSISNWLSNAG